MVMLLCFFGCSVKQPFSDQPRLPRRASAHQPCSLANGIKPEQSEKQIIVRELYKHYSEWKSVAYKWGGMSKNGIDCSAFAMLTYQSIFGITIPRTTALQIKSGKEISLKEIRPGDLLFFKTENLGRHVGIYLGDNKFMHASSSRGVTISRIDRKYWKNIFFRGIRIGNMET